MGLVARVFEGEGIPTVTMSSARDITDRIKPPRVAFLNYPLGNSVGRPDEPGEQREILRQALTLLESDLHPGSTVNLPMPWRDPSWIASLVRQYEREKEIVIRQRRESEYEPNTTAAPVHYAAREAAEVGALLRQ